MRKDSCKSSLSDGTINFRDRGNGLGFSVNWTSKAISLPLCETTQWTTHKRTNSPHTVTPSTHDRIDPAVHDWEHLR